MQLRSLLKAFMPRGSLGCTDRMTLNTHRRCLGNCRGLYFPFGRHYRYSSPLSPTPATGGNRCWEFLLEKNWRKDLLDSPRHLEALLLSFLTLLITVVIMIPKPEHVLLITVQYGPTSWRVNTP